MVVRVGLARPRRPGNKVPVMGLGVLFGLTVAYVFPGQTPTPVTASTRPMIVAEYDTVEVPVPDSYVPAGTKLGEVSVSMVKYPKHQLPSGALTTLSGLGDRVTTVALPARLPLYLENLADLIDLSNPIIERIPPGKRAITVQVDATAAVEGWAGSGSRVDVLLVGKDRSKVIASNVPVLSIERSAAPVIPTSVAKVPRTATILVSQEQALAVTSAASRGRITFALRSSKDDQEWYHTSSKQGARDEISGFARVKTGDDYSRFVLRDRRWVPATSRPSGFLTGAAQ